MTRKEKPEKVDPIDVIKQKRAEVASNAHLGDARKHYALSVLDDILKQLDEGVGEVDG